MTNDSKNTLTVIDIQNPNAPVIVHTTQAFGGPRRIAGKGSYLYVLLGYKAFQIFDITNPRSPVSNVSVGLGSTLNDLFIQGNYLYAVGQAD